MTNTSLLVIYFELLTVLNPTKMNDYSRYSSVTKYVKPEVKPFILVHTSKQVSLPKTIIVLQN